MAKSYMRLVFCLFALLAPLAAQAQLVGLRPIPDRVDFGPIPVGETLVRDMLVEMPYGAGPPDSMFVTIVPETAPFEILIGGGFRTLTTPAMYMVRIEFAPTEVGDWDIELDFGFGHGSLPLTGSASADFPDCQLSADEVVFLDTGLGERGLRYITVTNTGPVTLDLSPHVAEVMFRVEPDQVSLAPGESERLLLRFYPYREFLYTGVLEFGNDACRNVQVSGSGGVPGPDRVGIWFETVTGLPDLEKSPVGPEFGTAICSEGQPLLGHLVLRYPTATAPVTDFQLQLEAEVPLFLLSTDLPGAGVNYAVGNKFIVHYDVPLPIESLQVVLATFEFYPAAATDEAIVYLQPISTVPGVVPAEMSYTAFAVDHELTPNSGEDQVGWVQILQVSDVPDTPAVATTRLLANVPNPFNPQTVINWVLAEPGACRVVVHDLAGRRVRELWSGPREAGPQAVTWHGRDDAGRSLASGAYYVRLEAGDVRDTRKVMLLK